MARGVNVPCRTGTNKSRLEDFMGATAEVVKDSVVRTAEELVDAVIIGPEAYISEDYARAERDKLWRKVWQQVGRVEEIPEVGNYLTYDIAGGSILVVR